MATKRTTKPTKKKIKVVFVCTGNTCRSPMAEMLFKYILGKKRKLSLFDVSSAGLAAEAGDPMTDTAVAALKEMKVPIRKKHVAQPLTRQAADSADLIVCMTERHKSALLSLGGKVKTVAEITGGADVPDPFGCDLAVYRKTAEYLLYACEDVYTCATQLAENSPQ